MSNIFVNIPVPAANGSGAPVSMAAFGYSKSISVAGPFDAAVTIEISNELVPATWSPVVTFNRPDGIVSDVACRWMRASVAGYKSGAPSCDVGGGDDGTLFGSFPVLAGNGPGAAVDISTLGLFKTVTVGGVFRGSVQVEISEDGITNWSQFGFGFGNPGQQSMLVAARFARVVRAGVPVIAPGLPIVDIAGCPGPGGMGAGGVVPTLYSPPEQWGQQNIAASQVAVQISTLVSTNFDTIRMIRPGSIVGLCARLTEAITAGQLTVQITINGAPAALQLVMVSPTQDASITQGVGVDTYVAGDLIGMRISTDAGFLPVSTDLEAWLQLAEVI